VLGEGAVIPLARLGKWVRKLAAVSFHERIEQFGLREDRADVILPAGVVYLKIGEIFGVDLVFVPSVGLKEGLLLDTIDELARRARSGAPKGAPSRRLGLGRRYDLDLPHAVRVADLALSLYDQLGDLHGLGDEERTLLEAAALLHDVGLYVSMAKHHKHSYYLISESDLVGLDRRQREIAANVARYHRKAHPTAKHPLAVLSSEDRSVVAPRRSFASPTCWTGSTARVAPSRSDAARRGCSSSTRRAISSGEVGARSRFGLFEAVFGVKIALADE
jgi:exopolyphosphatase/guanosine-5'-triphosphate,3'-diphosphate pyrophosphatase